MKKLFIILLTVFMIVVTGCEQTEPTKPEPVEKTDAEKVKEEYESLNGTVREADKEKYNTVSLRDDNVFVYIDTKKALELINSDEAIIYVGAGWCPWCRSAVGLIDGVASSVGIKTIYYLNLDEEKSMYEIKNGALEKTKEGSENYYKLLDALKEYLSDYNLTDDSGKVYKTGEKRIYIPYMLGIKDGKVVSSEYITTKLEAGQTKYSELTDKQKDSLTSLLMSIYSKVHEIITPDTCEGEKCE